MKKTCAEAALKYIKNHTIIGLGGGSTISYLIEFIKEAGLKVKVVTPSMTTAQKCIENGLEVVHTFAVDEIDIAFDGCDQITPQLDALKSGGAIHTKEKIIATMAKDYILLVDETKVIEELNLNQMPIVLEVLNEGKAYVEKCLKALGADVKMRTSSAKDGYTISDHGHLIMEAYFKGKVDLHALNEALLHLCGVVDTSLFYQIATRAIVVSESGITVMERKGV